MAAARKPRVEARRRAGRRGAGPRLGPRSGPGHGSEDRLGPCTSVRLASPPRPVRRRDAEGAVGSFGLPQADPVTPARVASGPGPPLRRPRLGRIEARRTGARRGRNRRQPRAALVTWA